MYVCTHAASKKNPIFQVFPFYNDDLMYEWYEKTFQLPRVSIEVDIFEALYILTFLNGADTRRSRSLI